MINKYLVGTKLSMNVSYYTHYLSTASSEVIGTVLSLH